MVFDEDRNQLYVPLVRPENENVYRQLLTSSAQRQKMTSESPQTAPLQSPVGIIGRPSRLQTEQTPSSPPTSSGSVLTSAAPSDIGESRKSEPSAETVARSSTDLGQSRTTDDSKSITGSEKSFTTTPTTKTNPGVWANSWRSTSTGGGPDKSNQTNTASSYARAGSGASSRGMKILRPSAKTMSSVSRTTSNSAGPATNGSENAPPSRPGELERKGSQSGSAANTDVKTAPTKSNPVGSASAFGWLSASNSRRSAANGGD